MSDQDDEFERIMRNLDEERRGEPRPEAGEREAGGQAFAQRIAPPPRVALRLPLAAGRPVAAQALLAINIIVFILPSVFDLIGLRPPGDLTWRELTLIWGAKDNAAIALGGQYYRFLSAMFLHGGLAHIFFNGFAIYSLGFEAERIYGTQRFLALYLIAGLGGGLASYALNPSPSVGASGAIFGLVGGLAAFYYVGRKVLGSIARQQLGSLIFITLVNLALGFTTPYIDNNAHIGGLVAGAAAGWLLTPRFAVDTRLYPPEVVRLSLRYAWPAALALLALIVAAALIVSPPIP